VNDKAIIVDIDGTLSNPNHRRYLVEGENKDWEQFFEKVDEDPVNEWCHQITNRFWPDYDIILVTGRPEKSKDGVDVKEETVSWLRDKGIYFDRLVMRKEGDFREDTVVKQEILDKELPDPGSILFAVDDRSDIAEMWRKNGITCLQCRDEVEK